MKQPASGQPPAATQYRAARRTVALRYHPDRGGDLETYLAELSALERRYGVGTPATSTPATILRVSRRSAMKRRIRRVHNRFRKTRYIQI